VQQLGAVTLEQAVDDQDQKLALRSGPMGPGGGAALMPGGLGALGGGGLGALGGGIAMALPSAGSGQTTVRLGAGPKESKSLALLKGTIAAHVLTDAEQMIVAENVLEAAGKSFKGKRDGLIKILAVTKQANGVQIRFEFEMPAGVVAETEPQAPALVAVPAPGGAKVNVRVMPLPAAAPGARIVLWGTTPAGRQAFNGLTVRDDKGKVLNASISLDWKGFAPGAGGGKATYIAHVFPPAKGEGAAARLVFTARRSVEVPIPFTLKNVALK
jgi:hypothetical protein